MQEKYNRGFTVKRCEAAEGDQYKGDFFISFNNGVHAFYDSEKDKFFDDRQTTAIIEAINRDIWLPMCESLRVPYINVDDKTVFFNLVYQYQRGGKEYKYCMFNTEFKGVTTHFLRHDEISISSENLILLCDNSSLCKDFYNKVKNMIDAYFHNQKEGDLNFYVVNEELQSRQDFQPENIDETVHGTIAHIHFGEENYLSMPRTLKTQEGLYSMVCCKNEFVYQPDDIRLVPVENPEEVMNKIKQTMDKQDVSLIDKYTSKKRNIDYEGVIYTLEYSSAIKAMKWKDITLAFIMKTTDEPLTEYAEMNEKQHSFFAYDMNGGGYNATCLCSPGSRSTLLTCDLDAEVYFWFGSQS